MSGVLILKDLQQLRDMNARIAEVSGIVDRQMSYVLGELARALSALGAAGADAAPTPQFLPGPANVAHLMGTLPKNQVQELSDTMHRQTTAALGPAWSTFQRLKFEATVHRLARQVARRFGFPSESGRPVSSTPHSSPGLVSTPPGSRTTAPISARCYADRCALRERWLRHNPRVMTSTA